MNGWIEVTDYVFDKKKSINLNHISHFYKNNKSVSLIVNGKLVSVKESYEQVKKLIANASNDCAVEQVKHTITLEPIDPDTLKLLKSKKK